MSEMLDLLNKNGEKIGKISKNEAHQKGLWHKTIHAWIINSNNEILVQKRCEKKDYYPLVWDCSIGGHISFGETPLTSAVREAREELGLNLNESDFKYVFTVKEELTYKDINCKEFADVFIVNKDVNLNKLKFQKEEVESAKFIKLKEFFNNCFTNKFFPHIEEYEKLTKYFNYK